MNVAILPEELKEIKAILKNKNIKISTEEIQRFFQMIVSSQEVFPRVWQRALLIRLINVYKKTKKKEVIFLEELEKDKSPVTIILGALAEDWPGMSNAILGIIHHKEKNVLFMKAISVRYRPDRLVGIVILAFQLNTDNEYQDFLKERKSMIFRIKEASRGGITMFSFLDDEALKYEIYNDIIKKIKKIYNGDDLDKVIGKNGEAFLFVSSRSKEYLIERKISDLAFLIIDNFKFQKKIRLKEGNEVIKIKNIETIKEKLTGITFVCRHVLFSVEDFLKTLNFIVPGHVIKHHKSFVTGDGILVYRIEIVDQNNQPLNSAITKFIGKSLEKSIVAASIGDFSQVKSIGGVEHFARAIIPFLMNELRRTLIPQVYISVDNKTDFSLNIKLIVVSWQEKKSRLPKLVARLISLPGVEIYSIIPPRHYHEGIEINLLKMNIKMADFSSVREVFKSLKDILKKIFGQIRDFDEGFRETDMSILKELILRLHDVDPILIRDIFFNFDELYRIETPLEVLYHAIIMAARMVDESAGLAEKEVMIDHQDLPSLNKTVIVISCQKQKKLLKSIINVIENHYFNFSKFDWNQKTYLILIIRLTTKKEDAKIFGNIKKVVHSS